MIAPALAAVALLAGPSSALGEAVRYEYEFHVVDAAGGQAAGSRAFSLGVTVTPTDDGLLAVLDRAGTASVALRTVPARLARDLHRALRSADEPIYGLVVDGKPAPPNDPSWPELAPLGDAVAGPARVLEAIRNGFRERWLGEPWKSGSTWRGADAVVEVREACETAGIAGVSVAIHGPDRAEHVVCAAPELPFPISSVGAAGVSEANRFRTPPRWSARLVRRETTTVRERERAAGLWNGGPSLGLALRGDGMGAQVRGLSEIARAAVSGAAKCQVARTFEWVWDGSRTLELGPGRTRAGVHVNEVVRALRLDGTDDAPRLTERGAGSPDPVRTFLEPVPGTAEETCPFPRDVRIATALSARAAWAAPGAKPHLTDAAEQCDRALTLGLLAGGANPRHARVPPPSQYGRRAPEAPIHAAAFCGDPAIVRALLDGGADPNATEDGWPVLSRALTGGAPEVVALLLARGARADARGPDESLFERTVLMNRRDLYELFVKAGRPGGLAEVLLALEVGDAAALRTALGAGQGRWAAEARSGCGPRCPADLAEVIAGAERARGRR